MAMVLGTALSAAGSAAAGTATPEATLKAVADMSRYCTTCWRNARLEPDAWADCTQDVFGRLLERLPADAWNRIFRTDGDERREFVRAIDTVKKRAQRGRKWYPASLDNLADRRATDNEVDREAVERAARRILSPRQRDILLKSGEGWSVQEIARELQMRPERVSDEKYKAVQKLQQELS
jgi:RNA polymerase sigma factor (sigma-70 family)